MIRVRFTRDMRPFRAGEIVAFLDEARESIDRLVATGAAVIATDGMVAATAQAQPELRPRRRDYHTRNA